MRKQTTTQQLQQLITDNLLHITLAEKYSKSTRQTDAIDAETFKKSLDFLCESVFSDCIGWHFERNDQTGQYLAECGRMNGDVDVIVTAYMSANDDVSREVIDSALMRIEEE